MPTDPKQQNPKECEPSRRGIPASERRPARADEGREGMPGYGQPDEDVRDKRLPEQKW